MVAWSTGRDLRTFAIINERWPQIVEAVGRTEPPAYREALLTVSVVLLEPSRPVGVRHGVLYVDCGHPRRDYNLDREDRRAVVELAVLAVTRRRVRVESATLRERWTRRPGEDGRSWMKRYMAL